MGLLNALYCITDVTLHLMKRYTLFCIYKIQNYANTFSQVTILAYLIVALISVYLAFNIDHPEEILPVRDPNNILRKDVCIYTIGCCVTLVQKA